MAERKSTTERGLGFEHQRIRKALLPYAYGKPCALCDRVMSKGQRLELDHSIPRALGGTRGDRMVHEWCNRSAGGHLGAALRQGRSPTPPLPTSRPW